MAKSGFDTRMYFDKKAVMDVVGKARVAVLARQGALVRKIMRNSMRKRKGNAPPGSPPFAHQGNLKLIEFAFDPQKNDVVVGPIKLANGKATWIQDKGGPVTVRGVVVRKKTQVDKYGRVHGRGEFLPLYMLPVKARVDAVYSGRIISVKGKVEARPFSQPALKKAKPLLAKEWKGKVKK